MSLLQTFEAQEPDTGKGFGLADVLVVLFCVCYILHYGRLSYILPGIVRTIALAGELALFAAGLCLCVVRGRYAAAIWFLIAFGYLIFQGMWFAYNFHSPVLPQGLAAFFPALAFVVFTPALIKADTGRLMKILLVVAVIYAVIYIVLTLTLAANLAPDEKVEGLVIAAEPGSGRPNRVFLAIELIVLGSAISLCYAMVRKRLIYLLPLCVFVPAAVLSYSRAFLIVYGVTFLAYIVVRSARWVGAAFLAGLAIFTIFLIAGLSVSDLRPFTLLDQHDPSGVIRDMSFRSVQMLMEQYWPFGVGFATDPQDNERLMGTDLFHASDLGMVGILYLAGVVGVLVYFGLSLIALSPPWLKNRPWLAREDAEAIGLAGALFVFYSLITTMLWGGIMPTIAAAILLARAPTAYSPEAEDEEAFEPEASA